MKLRKQKKSCVVSRSFGKRIGWIEEAVANYCLNASEKIRSESLVAKAITVLLGTVLSKRLWILFKCEDNWFSIATNNSIETVKFDSILESIFKNGYRYQKAGVMLTGLRNDDDEKIYFHQKRWKNKKFNAINWQY